MCRSALIFALAPLPNFICSRCAGADDFSTDYSSGPVDFGHFLTSCFLISGVALPFTLAHAGVIHSLAGWMSAVGGAVGYGTSKLIYCQNSCPRSMETELRVVSCSDHLFSFLRNSTRRLLASQGLPSVVILFPNVTLIHTSDYSKQFGPERITRENQISAKEKNYSYLQLQKKSRDTERRLYNSP